MGACWSGRHAFEAIDEPTVALPLNPPEVAPPKRQAAEAVWEAALASAPDEDAPEMTRAKGEAPAVLLDLSVHSKAASDFESNLNPNLNPNHSKDEWWSERVEATSGRSTFSGTAPDAPDSANDQSTRSSVRVSRSRSSSTAVCNPKHMTSGQLARRLRELNVAVPEGASKPQLQALLEAHVEAHGEGVGAAAECI